MYQPQVRVHQGSQGGSDIENLKSVVAGGLAQAVKCTGTRYLSSSLGDENNNTNNNRINLKMTNLLAPSLESASGSFLWRPIC